MAKSAKPQGQGAARKLDLLARRTYLTPMTIRPILTVPNPILKQISKPIERVDDDVRALMSDMLDSMYAAKGIGLAAVQIGVPLRVIVMDLEWGKEDAPDHFAPRFFANPEIIWTSEDTNIYDEGCLSVPEYYDGVARPARCRLRYLNRENEVVEEDCDGMFATCIQHEMDHLEGVLFIDHLSRLRRDRAIAKVKKVSRMAV
ncbi:MAG: hypothetical protein RL186_1511 [Pseudomonadota bacterium]|jgi:peptide deformylase